MVTRKPTTQQITKNPEGQAILIVNRRRGNNSTETKQVNVLVDEKLWHDLSEFTWTVSSKNEVKTGQGSNTVLLKQKILDLESPSDNFKCEDIIYVNGNPLDNRRVNLRTKQVSAVDNINELPADTPLKDMVYDEILRRWICSFKPHLSTRVWVGFSKTIEEGLEMRRNAMRVFADTL